MARLELEGHCSYCKVDVEEGETHECDMGALKALLDEHEDRWAKTCLLALELIGRLDVMLPKVEGVVNFQSLRQGTSAYDGPNPHPWIEKMRDHCRLKGMTRTERDFWPDDYCKTCDGSGMVMPAEGLLPQNCSLELYVRSVPDRAAAYRLLRRLDPKLTATAAYVFLDGLAQAPRRVLRKGWNPVDAHEHVRAWVELGVEFVYHRAVVLPCYDVCPDCKGTANRGLPEAHPWKPGPWEPEAPVELQMVQKEMDGSLREMPQEELERLFRHFARGEEY